MAPDLPILAIALAGFAVAGYLTWIKWSGTGALFCTAGSGCDIVQASRYAIFLGVPTALWGALAYLAVAILAGLGLDGRKWRAALVLAAGAVGFSAYLTFLSVTELGAACVYCLVSAVLSVLLLVVLVLRRPRVARGARGCRWPCSGRRGGGGRRARRLRLLAAGPEGATPYQLRARARTLPRPGRCSTARSGARIARGAEAQVRRGGRTPPLCRVRSQGDELTDRTLRARGGAVLPHLGDRGQPARGRAVAGGPGGGLELPKN